MMTPIVSPEMRQPGKRPFGIYAIIVLLVLTILVAILDLLRLRYSLTSPLLLQIAEALRESASLSALPALLIENANLLALLDVAIILLVLVTAIGLWFRLRSAWVLAMVLIGVGLGYNIWKYLEGTPHYLSMLIHVVAVFYLNERSVRQVFERPSPDTMPPPTMWP